MVPLWAVEPAVVEDVVACRPRFEPGIVLFASELFHWLKKRVVCQKLGFLEILKLSASSTNLIIS